jgi:hypothetical protein
VPLAAGCVFPLVIAVNVARWARNVPYKDQWGLVPFMVEVAEGRLRPHLLWEQVNEHRIPLALLLQAGLARLTRWDVRAEVWANVAIALATLVALVAAVRRTVGPLGRGAAPWVVAVISLLTFSPAGGFDWTWGMMTAPRLATLFAALLAWLLAGWSGSWGRVVAMLGCAAAAALSFGSGLVLLALLPLALLVAPAASPRRRTPATLLAAGSAALFLALYLIGWHPRLDAPPPVLRPDRVDYARYVIAFVGGGLGRHELGPALGWGIVTLVAVVAGGAWLWSERPHRRASLVPWMLLALYSVASGAVTAYGRLDAGLHTAVLVRYLVTASFFQMATVVIVALVVDEVRTRSRRAAVVAAGGVVGATLVAAVLYWPAARIGFWAMERHALELDVGAECLPACRTAPDRCLLLMCWSAEVARRMCGLAEQAEVGFSWLAARPRPAERPAGSRQSRASPMFQVMSPLRRGKSVTVSNVRPPQRWRRTACWSSAAT